MIGLVWGAEIEGSTRVDEECGGCRREMWMRGIELRRERRWCTRDEQRAGNVNDGCKERGRGLGSERRRLGMRE